MTANEIVITALDMLGLSTENGNTQIPPRIMNRAVSIVNVVYEDLWGIAAERTVEDVGPYKPITVLYDKIDLNDRALGIMPYGVAAFIAQSESDGDQQQVWMSTYNKKRRTLAHGYTRVDTMPKAEV